MKLLALTAIVSCLASQTMSKAIPQPDNAFSPTNYHTIIERLVDALPPSAPICDGYSVNVAGISAAVGQALKALADSSIPTGAGNYPHEYKNYETFVFASCPSGSGLLYEYPVLRNGINPWVPAKSTKLSTAEFDRVVFQNSATGVFCGMITHSGAPKAGGFIQCL